MPTLEHPDGAALVVSLQRGQPFSLLGGWGAGELVRCSDSLSGALGEVKLGRNSCFRGGRGRNPEPGSPAPASALALLPVPPTPMVHASLTTQSHGWAVPDVCTYPRLGCPSSQKATEPALLNPN